MEAIYNKITGKTSCPLLDLVRLNKQTKKTLYFLKFFSICGSNSIAFKLLSFLKVYNVQVGNKNKTTIDNKGTGREEVQAKKQNAALHSFNGCIVKSCNMSIMEPWSGRQAKSRHSPFSPFFLCPSASSQICTTLLFLFPFLYVQGTVPFSTFTLDYIWWPFEPPVSGAQKVLFV